MNYIKIEINGKEYGGKFGTKFLRNVCYGEGHFETINDKEVWVVMPFTELFERIAKESFLFLPELIYYAIETNFKLKGEKLDLTKDDLDDYFDTIGLTSAKSIELLNTLTSSLNVEIQESEGNKIPQKKAVVKK